MFAKIASTSITIHGFQIYKFCNNLNFKETSRSGRGFQGESSILQFQYSTKGFKFNFYFYIQNKKTLFFNTIAIHIAIIYEKVHRMDEEQAVFEKLI